MNKYIIARVQKSYFHRNLQSAIFQLEFLKHENINIYLGILHFENQNFSRALFYLKKQTTITTKYYEALCYKNRGEYQKAVDSLIHIIDNKCGEDVESETFFDLFIISDYEYVNELLGECLSHINEREQATIAYLNACNAYPLYNSVINLLIEGKGFKIKNTNSQEMEFFEDLIEFYKTRDEVLIQKYKMKMPGIGTYFLGECGKVYIDDGDFDRSSIIFEAIRKLDPFNFEFFHFFSTLLWYKKDTEKLSQLCRTLIEYIPKSFIVWIALGNYFSLKFDHSRSVVCFKRSLQIDTNYYSHLLLGHEYILKQEYGLAQKCFTHSIKLFKNNYNAFFSIGLIYANSGKKESAEQYLLKGIKMNGRNKKLKVLLMEFYNKNQLISKTLPVFLEVFNLKKFDVNTLTKHIKNKQFDMYEELALLEIIDFLLSEGFQDKCEEIIDLVKYRGRGYQKKRELVYGKIN